MIIEFSDNEENVYSQTIELLSKQLRTSPMIIQQEVKGLNINPFTRTVTDDKGNKIHLTAKEFDLLYFLSSHKGQVFTKEQIYENVWGYDNAPDASNLSSFIRKLRLKIEPYPDNPRYIITVWGVGYKFSEEEKP
ncbi:winged helix-turn-helix domain-containing protein [Massilimicrobiota sp. An134]|uniref:winged helix-turn-helix domain-containing protein n=1 Tax=Massilimicrobiota sp. An134 TaxID=1965557 RepID=UPI001F14CC90|nr:winged helix-turn-helix domain-containing protein [Massilimicrobiota sp. An134]